MRALLCLCFLFFVCPAHASEPAVDTLPPELVRLRDEGRLTVRALWAWKLVPEATSRMALELRQLGMDLPGADLAAVSSWLADADAGKLSLSGEQRSFLEDIAARMQPESKEVVAPDASGTTDVQTQAASSPPPDSAGGASGNASIPELLSGLEAGDGGTGGKVALALAVRAGVDGSPDPVRSVALLEEAAGAGDADAMALLADEYESGILVPYDAQKARTLREEAAKAGSLLARWALEEN